MTGTSPATSAESRTGTVVDYPFGEIHQLDMEPEYAALYEEPGLVQVTMPYGGAAWLASRYEHVKAVLLSPAFSRTVANHENQPSLSAEVLPDAALLSLDPPVHSRVRKSVAAVFTVRVMEEFRATVAGIVADTVGTLNDTDGAELVEDVVLPIALTSVSRLLGIDPSNTERLMAGTRRLRERDISPVDRAEVRVELEAIFRQSLGQHDADQATVAAALSDAVSEGRISDDEAMQSVMAIFVGGIGSPTTFLASAICALLREPEQFTALDPDPDVVAVAVEELLRFVPVGVAGGFPRTAVDDVFVGSTQVRAGETVLPAMTAANRDPFVFTEPDRLDLGRRPNPHLGFGHGLHHCIGSHLARIEAQELLGALRVERPQMQLASRYEDVEWKTGLVVREIERLDVTW